MRSPDLTRRPRTKRRFSDADMARMRDLYYDRDTPMTKVADAFGVPVSTFLRWIAEMDWPRRTASGPGGGREVFAYDTPTPGSSPQGGGKRAPLPDPPPQGGRETPLDVDELSYQVAAAARGQLQSMGDVGGPMTLAERQRRADIIASLSRSIARVDRTFERRVERAGLKREVERLRQRVRALENPHLAEVERLTIEAMRREVGRGKDRRG